MRSPRRTREASVWAYAAIAGVVVYVLVDVALVFLRPHLSVLHNAESDYGSKGRYAWVMDANFVLRCLLSLAVVRALALVGGPPRLRAAARLAPRDRTARAALVGSSRAGAACSGACASVPARSGASTRKKVFLAVELCWLLVVAVWTALGRTVAST